MEDMLREKGILGDSDPKGLLRAVFWLIGVNIGIHGGNEQHELSAMNFQFSVDEKGKQILIFKEMVSKTFKGGLAGKPGSYLGV